MANLPCDNSVDTKLKQCVSALTIIKSDNEICMAIINFYLAFFFIPFSFLYDNIIAINRCIQKCLQRIHQKDTLKVIWVL